MEPDPEEQAHTMIHATHRDWMEAVSAADTYALRDLLTEDYEAWPAAAAPIIGREAAVAALRRAFASVAIEQSFQSDGLLVCGDWAIDRGLESFVMIPRDGGPQRAHRQRAVILLRRDGEGNWRYAWGTTSPEPSKEGSR